MNGESDQKVRKKRSREQRELDKMLVVEYRLKGKTFREIGKIIGMSYRTAHNDYLTVEREWRERSADMVSKIKEESIAKLDLIAREAWEGYEKSKEEFTKTRERSLAGGEGDDVDLGLYEVIRESRTGNPRYLEVVLKCIHDKLSLAGLEPPKRLEVSGDFPKGLSALLAMADQQPEVE